MKNLFPDIPWRVVCPDVRAYTTHYAFEDCIGLLCRKNVHDTFEYTFFWKDGYFIQLDAPRISRTLDMRFCKGSVFSMEFERLENGTRFLVRFHHVQGREDGVAYISQTHLDQFFEVKLDAKPCWPKC